MATKKKTTIKKTTTKKSIPASDKERLDKLEKQLATGMKEAKKVGDDVVKKLGELKTKFDEMDQTTKKKVVAGIAGALAVVAGLSGAKHAYKKSKKNKKKR